MQLVTPSTLVILEQMVLVLLLRFKLSVVQSHPNLVTLQNMVCLLKTISFWKMKHKFLWVTLSWFEDCSGRPNIYRLGCRICKEGSITDIRLINGGNGYTKLPVITSITTSGGSNAKLLPISTSGIGSVQDVKITNFGFQL